MPTFRQDTKIGGMVPMMKTDDYNDQSVTEEKLKDGAITTRKIADGSVTKDKLAPSIRQEINDSVTASNEATEKAKEATAKADQATENAKQATAAATAAKEAADTATQLATNATTASVQATEQAKAATTKAEEATVKANEAAQKADDSREQTEQTLGTMQEVIDKVAIKDEEGALIETPFRYIQNEEFIFAKVDAEDRLLFGIQWDGTPVFGKTSAVEDRLQSQVTLLAERVATIMGDEDTTNVIDTMNELKKFFAEIENTETLTGILANLDNVAKNLDKTTIKDEEGNVQDTPFKVIENEEFIIAVVDSDDRVLYGIYRDTGKPYYPQNDMYHISQSEEFLWVILDAVNHPLLGILQDGTCWAAKAQWLDDIKAIKEALSSIDETLKTFQPKEDGKGLINLDVADSFFYISNDEYIIAVVDAENRILAGIKYDGQPYFPNHEMYSVIANKEWLYAIIDAEDKVLCGFRANDGHMIVGGIDINTFIVDVADIKERTAHLSTIENDEYLSVETDSDGKVIGYTASDGSHYLYKVKSETIPTEFSHIEDPEGRTEITTDSDGKVIGYRDSEGTRHEIAVNTKKLFQNKKEYDLSSFVNNSTVETKIQRNNESLSLLELNGVKDHGKQNLLNPLECTKSYTDGVNTFSPPNAGYILSNPIECKAGDTFTRTGTATGMVVVSDREDKNAKRLMTNGQLPGSTLQIPYNWGWASFIRFAVQESALESLIISKGKYTIEKEESGDFCTIDKLKIQSFNLSNDVAYIKSTDGKYFQLYIDAADNYAIKAKEVDTSVIQPNNLPSDWVSFSYSGTFNGLFDRFVICNNKFLLEMSEKGITKFKKIGNATYLYHNAEHFYNSNKEGRYAVCLQGAQRNDTIGVGFCLFDENMVLIEKDLNSFGQTINDTNWSKHLPDNHDFVYIDDGHYIFYEIDNQEVTVEGFGTKRINGYLVHEVKRINGAYKVIGEFSSHDYPKLYTDIYNNPTINIHMNTIGLDYDGNLIVNYRDCDSFIKIRRTVNEDGTVILGSASKNYDEAIIGRVGGQRNIGYLDSKRVLPETFSFTTPPTGTSVSPDPVEDWQWYHSHDVKYWGMKEINGKSYPTYTMFDNNYWTREKEIQNQRNNYRNNPKCNGWAYEVSKGADVTYKEKTISRFIQISIDWDNKKIIDYKIYEIPEYFSQEMSGATMLSEGIFAASFSYMGVWGVYDFVSELGTTTIQNGKIYKGAKKVFESKYDAYRYCYRANVYNLKNK